MARAYKHLTYTDRLRIEKWLKDGYTYRQIADKLRVHISTIYREVKKASISAWTIGHMNTRPRTALTLPKSTIKTICAPRVQN